jgi:hypothetical protein
MRYLPNLKAGAVTCPQQVRTDNRRETLDTIWESPEWKAESAAYKARHFPLCTRCGCVAHIVPGHTAADYTPAEIGRYIQKVRDDQVVPLCHKCNRMESKGRRPCPGCIGRHREDPTHYIRYIGQDQDRCHCCEIAEAAHG